MDPPLSDYSDPEEEGEEDEAAGALTTMGILFGVWATEAYYLDLMFRSNNTPRAVKNFFQGRKDSIAARLRVLDQWFQEDFSYWSSGRDESDHMFDAFVDVSRRKGRCRHQKEDIQWPVDLLEYARCNLSPGEPVFPDGITFETALQNRKDFSPTALHSELTSTRGYRTIREVLTMPLPKPTRQRDHKVGGSNQCSPTYQHRSILGPSQSKPGKTPRNAGATESSDLGCDVPLLQADRPRTLTSNLLTADSSQSETGKTPWEAGATVSSKLGCDVPLLQADRPRTLTPNTSLLTADSSNVVNLGHDHIVGGSNHSSPTRQGVVTAQPKPKGRRKTRAQKKKMRAEAIALAEGKSHKRKLAVAIETEAQQEVLQSEQVY